MLMGGTKNRGGGFGGIPDDSNGPSKCFRIYLVGGVKNSGWSNVSIKVSR